MSSHSEQSPNKCVDSHFDCEVTHRIDSPHQANTISPVELRHPAKLERVVAFSANSGLNANASGSIDQSDRSVDSPGNQEHPCLDSQWIGIAHAEDLLDYVQRLSEDLDARSTKLHADIAVQERRERAFRLWAQQRSEELRVQRDECEREREQLKIQARRMALTENDGESETWFSRGNGNR